jgi:hypothetical protein
VTVVAADKQKCNGDVNPALTRNRYGSAVGTDVINYTLATTVTGSNVVLIPQVTLGTIQTIRLLNRCG